MSKAALSRLPIWGWFARDRSGAVAVAVAVLLPILIGLAGIGVEVGLWFAIQRQNQSAADAAAISAALEFAAQIQRGVATDPAAATAAANTTANYNLFRTSPPNTLTLYPCHGFTVGSSCNTSSSNGAPLNAVQVVLTQPLNTTFASFVTSIWGPNVNKVNVTTTAIAAFPQMSSACILALDPTAENAVSVDNGTVSNPNCWVASNSSSGSALNCDGCTITGPTTVVGGDAVSNNGHLNGSPNRTYASAVANPYAIPPGCPVVSGGFITPGHYCDGIQLNSGAIYTMAPGVYYIDKVFSISNGSTLIANGVTIVINSGGAMQVGANSTLNITAPSTGSIPILEVYLAL